MMTTSDRQGSTLIELLVVLFILGILGSLSALSLANTAVRREPSFVERLALARDSALRTGRPVQVIVDTTREGAVRVVLFLPDGRAIGPRAESLTGIPLTSIPSIGAADHAPE